jgi:uncharacterized protein (TIGR03437 family)
VPPWVTLRGCPTCDFFDGRVLLAGGIYLDSRTQRVEPPNILASAEIYTPPNLTPTATLLSLAGDGRGQGAIQHADTGRVVSADNPATVGEVIVINCTGFLDGSISPPQIAVGGRAAEILSFGMAPGDTGLNQVTVHVPTGLTPGSAVPVRMNYLGRHSNEVTIGLQ